MKVSQLKDGKIEIKLKSPAINDYFYRKFKP